MHVQVVNFNLRDMTDARFRSMANEVAPAFASVPGLLGKIWLADAGNNTYGGVYIWSDRGAMEAYKQTDIYKGMQANPHFENVIITDFAVVESATRVTRGPAQAAA